MENNHKSTDFDDEQFPEYDEDGERLSPNAYHFMPRPSGKKWAADCDQWMSLDYFGNAAVKAFDEMAENYRTDEELAAVATEFCEALSTNHGVPNLRAYVALSAANEPEIEGRAKFLHTTIGQSILRFLAGLDAVEIRKEIDAIPTSQRAERKPQRI